MSHPDEAPDPRHDRPGNSVFVIGLVCAVAFLLVVAGVAVLTTFYARARSAELAALARAEEAARAEANAKAEVERALDLETANRHETERAAKGGKLIHSGPGAQTLPPQVDSAPIHLASLTVSQADRLDGRVVLITLNLLDNDERRGAFTVSSNDGPDGDDIERAVWVPVGRKVDPTGRVLGVLHVIRHETAVGADGTGFTGSTELRVILDP